MPRRMVKSHLLIPFLLMGFLIQFTVPLLRIATTYMAVGLSMSPYGVLVLSACFAIAPLSIVLAVGRYNDRHGVTNTLLAGGILLSSVSILHLIVPVSVATLTIGMFMAGAGQVLIMASLQVSVASLSSLQHRDRILSHLLMSQSLGQTLAPLSLSLVSIGKPAPDTGLLIIIALSISLIAILVATQMRSMRPKAAISHANVPLADIIRSPGIMWLSISGGFCVATQDMILVFMPILGIERGINSVAIGLMLSLSASAQMLSRIAYPKLNVRLGRVRLMVISLLAVAIALGLIAAPLPTAGTFAALLLLGPALGLSLTSSIALTLRLAPVAARGTTMSIRLAVNRLSQFTVPLLAGLAAAPFGAGSVFLFLSLAIFTSSVTRPRNLPRFDPSRPPKS
jgi:MFS family permease